MAQGIKKLWEQKQVWIIMILSGSGSFTIFLRLRFDGVVRLCGLYPEKKHAGIYAECPSAVF